MISLMAYAASAVLAAPAAPAAPSTPEIEVKGRTREEARAFVQSLGVVGAAGQLSRWNSPVCPATYGLPEAYGRLLIQRIQQVAGTFDIPRDTRKCIPNIVILSIPDADQVMARFVAKHGALGRDWTQGLPPRAQVEQLLTPRPVRWFHASLSVGSDASHDGFARPLPAGALQLASRLKLSTREDARLVVIVLDPDRIVGATWDELADYVTMVALARPQLGADFSAKPTILALYGPNGLTIAPPERMTREDKVFLEALYASDERATAAQQREQIVRRLQR